MDDRTTRIGEHAAASQPAWALRALGEMPADPGVQTEWQRRVVAIGGYRELYGHEAQADPIGPAPGMTSPDTGGPTGTPRSPPWTRSAASTCAALPGFDLEQERQARLGCG